MLLSLKQFCMRSYIVVLAILKLACVSRSGAWPFHLAHCLVGGVISLANSVNERDVA